MTQDDWGEIAGIGNYKASSLGDISLGSDPSLNPTKASLYNIRICPMCGINELRTKKGKMCKSCAAIIREKVKRAIKKKKEKHP